MMLKGSKVTFYRQTITELAVKRLKYMTWCKVGLRTIRIRKTMGYR